MHNTLLIKSNVSNSCRWYVLARLKCIIACVAIAYCGGKMSFATSLAKSKDQQRQLHCRKSCCRLWRQTTLEEGSRRIASVGRQPPTVGSPPEIPACTSSLALHPSLPNLQKSCARPPSSIKSFSPGWNRASRQEMRSWTWSSLSWKELRPWWLFCTGVARINLRVKQAWDEQTAKQCKKLKSATVEICS